MILERILVADKDPNYGRPVTLREYKVLEVSPSEKYVKLMDMDEGNRYFPFWEAQGITLKPKFDHWREATVVVHDKGRPERVFTESEVRAMLNEMREDYHTEVSLHQFLNIAKSHGIDLDPA